MRTSAFMLCLAFFGFGTVACGPSVDQGSHPMVDADAAVDTAPSCPPGMTLCDDVCTNVRIDRDNCGACGTICADGQTCGRGVCTGSNVTPTPVTCTAPAANCDGNDANGCETNLTTDNANCGACGTRCNAGYACSSGRCQAVTPTGPVCGNNRCESGESCGTCAADCGACAPTCSAGTANCDGNNTNGCETNTASDARNCGACGRVCSTGQICNVGTCSAPALNCGPHTNCSGVCSDLSSDASNCGGCGVRCGSGSTCSGGTCVISAPVCMAGTANCDGNNTNGCETNTASDARNCGACGRICTGTATCMGGVCTAPTCTAGLTMCSGVCTSLLMDDRNCGACGANCAAVGAVCNAGRCMDPRPTCSGSGMTYCGTRCVNVYTDPTNCGGCGVTCGSGQVCSMGTCRSGMASDLSSIRVWYRTPSGVTVTGIGIYQLFDHAPSPGYLQPPCSVSGGMAGAFTSHTCGVLGRIPLSREIVLNTQVQLSPSESTRLSGRTTTWACAIYSSGGAMQVYGSMGAELDTMSIPLTTRSNGYDGCNFVGIAP